MKTILWMQAEASYNNEITSSVLTLSQTANGDAWNMGAAITVEIYQSYGGVAPMGNY